MFSVTYILLITSSIALLPSARSDCCQGYDEPCTTKLSQDMTPLVFEKNKKIELPPIDGQTPKLKIKLDPCVVEGLSECEVLRSEGNIKDNLWLLGVKCPLLNFTGNYESEGSVSGMPFNGQGPFWFVMENLEEYLTLGMDTLNGDDGNKYLSFFPNLYWYKMEHAMVAFENINGDPEKAKETNGKLNENWNTIMPQYARMPLGPLNTKVVEMINDVLKLKPKKELICEMNDE